MAIRRIIRRPEVERLTGLSVSTIDRKEEAGDFCKRVRISSNAVGWYEDEVVEWVETRPRGRLDAPTKANAARRKSEPKAAA